MKKIIFYIVLAIILVVYIYSIVFKAFPISTKIVLEAIGFLYCIRYMISPNYRLRKDYWVIIRIIAMIVVWDLMTSLINGQSEFHLIKYFVTSLGSIFCAQMIFSYTRKYIKIPETMLMAIVVTIFAESMLSLVMKVYPPAFDMVSSVLRFEFLENTRITFDQARFIGIGNAIFFGVLASCSLGVMTSVYLIRLTKPGRQRTEIIIMWMVIAIVSFFCARWSITLIGLSLLLFVIYQRGVNIGKTIATLFGVGFLAIMAYMIVMRNMNNELYEWAFSFLTDSSASNDNTLEQVLYWYTNVNFEFKTLFIGDALYALANGSYYGFSDVGYFRQIYYGGVVGLFLNLWVHYKTLKMTYKYHQTRIFKQFLTFLMLGYLAILGKGDASMLTFYILIMVYYTRGAFEYVPNRSVKSSSAQSINKI